MQYNWQWFISCGFVDIKTFETCVALSNGMNPTETEKALV